MAEQAILVVHLYSSRNTVNRTRPDVAIFRRAAGPRSGRSGQNGVCRMSENGRSGVRSGSYIGMRCICYAWGVISVAGRIVNRTSVIDIGGLGVVKVNVVTSLGFTC